MRGFGWLFPDDKIIHPLLWTDNSIDSVNRTGNLYSLSLAGHLPELTATNTHAYT